MTMERAAPTHGANGVPALDTINLEAYVTDFFASPTASFQAHTALGSTSPISDHLKKKKKSGPSTSKSSPRSEGNTKGQSPRSLGGSGGDIKTGRWEKEEHDRFLAGLERFGRSWKDIATYVKTRNHVQIRTHAQKYFAKAQRLGVATISNSDSAESPDVFGKQKRKIAQDAGPMGAKPSRAKRAVSLPKVSGVGLTENSHAIPRDEDSAERREAFFFDSRPRQAYSESTISLSPSLRLASTCSDGDDSLEHPQDEVYAASGSLEVCGSTAAIDETDIAPAPYGSQPQGPPEIDGDGDADTDAFMYFLDCDLRAPSSHQQQHHQHNQHQQQHYDAAMYSTPAQVYVPPPAEDFYSAGAPPAWYSLQHGHQQDGASPYGYPPALHAGSAAGSAQVAFPHDMDFREDSSEL